MLIDRKKCTIRTLIMTSTIRTLIMTSNQDEISKYLCNFCNQILNDPQQSSEDWRICKEHLDKKYFKDVQFYPDKATKMEMESHLTAIRPICMTYSATVIEVLRHLEFCN